MGENQLTFMDRLAETCYTSGWLCPAGSETLGSLWQQQFVSCCSLDFAVGISELQKGLWQQQTGQGLLEL